MGLGSISGLSGNALFDNVIENTGEIYDSTATYKPGEYCVHDDKLYKCIVAIDSAEAWTDDHWQLTNIGEELFDLACYGPSAFRINSKGHLILYYQSPFDPDIYSIDARGHLIMTLTV